jgi:uncharacterized protein DUF3955
MPKNRDVIFYVLTLISLLFAFFCLLLFADSQVYVDNEGFVHEPFYLVPIGYLFFAIAIIMVIVRFFRSR